VARLVCLLIDDNDEAQAYIDHIKDQEPYIVRAVPLAMFAVPTQYCECPQPMLNNADNRFKTTRGANLGWWIHRDCGKPLENSWQSPKNLLTPAGEHSRIHVNWTYQPPLIGQTGLKENSSSMP
jgi:hypothetical protein